MVTVLRANNSGNSKSTNEKWANAFSAMAGKYFENQEKEKKKQALTKAGIDPNLPPELQKLVQQYELMGGLEEKKLNKQYELKKGLEKQKYRCV